jgi:hypothetical protein
MGQTQGGNDIPEEALVLKGGARTYLSITRRSVVFSRGTNLSIPYIQ